MPKMSKRISKKIVGTCLVDTLERRNGLALVLVERRVNDTTELDLYVRCRRLALPRESVLHPFLIITLHLYVSLLYLGQGENTYIRVVLTSVGAARLLAVSGGSDGLDGILKEVAKLKSLDEVARCNTLGQQPKERFEKKNRDIRVPDHAPVLNTNLVVSLVDLSDLLDTLIQRLLGTMIFSENRTGKEKDKTHRKTAASDCMAFCMSRRILAVGIGPSAFLIRSRNSMLSMPASSGIAL